MGASLQICAQPVGVAPDAAEICKSACEETVAVGLPMDSAEEEAVGDGGYVKDTSGESPVDVVARNAEAEAASLLGDNRVLEAEALLSQTLGHLAAASDADAAAAAAERLRGSPVYAAVAGRAGQYYAVGKALAPSGFRLAWENSGSSLWVHAPADATWFEYKLVCDVHAPLSHCMAYSNELDLIAKHEPLLVGEPMFLGQVHPLRVVTHTLISVLMLRIELIFEVLRFCDFDYGLIAESIRSRFPDEGRPIPASHWRHKRIGLESKNIWVPRGGGEDGSVAVQVTRVEAGFRVPERILSFFISKVATTMVTNLRATASRVGEPGSPYEERLQLDKHGLYAKCAKAEAAAARRTSVSAANLPGEEIFQRATRLPPGAN